MEDAPILCFSCLFKALAGDPICLTALVLLLLPAYQGGRAVGESNWAGLILPLILPAPGQLSLTAGVARADGWSVSAILSAPLPLFDTGADAGTGTHVGSADGQIVSLFLLGLIIAHTIAALSEWEGNAIGAGCWRPLSTIVRVLVHVFPLLVAVSPLQTAAGAIGAAAAPLAGIVAEGFSAAGAIFFGQCADVATSPIEVSILPLASITSLTVVREEEEEEEQQPAPPCSQH